MDLTPLPVAPTTSSATDAAAAPARTPPPSLQKTLLKALLHDHLFWLLLLLLAGLSLADPARISSYPGLVDWPTMATLTGLLMLTKGVELSGFLRKAGALLLARTKSERSLALLLVGATALLAPLLTNDVALFVVVPLTLTLGRVGTGESPGTDDQRVDKPASGGLPVVRLIIFEALAANAGSTLTPIGNPQNLYLWQQSHGSFLAFCAAMLPLALLLLGSLLLLTACLFSGRANPPAPASQGDPVDPVNRPMLLTCLALYLPFLVLTDLHHAPAALAGVLAIFLLRHRRVLAQVDWALLLVFMLMFVDLRLVAAAAPVRALVASVDLAQAPRLYLAAIAASQLISNVPATILLAQYSHDWRTLAHGVNVGGAGLAIGSMANLIALRMAPQRRAWLLFHAYSVPYLVVTGAITWAWLTLR